MHLILMVILALEVGFFISHKPTLAPRKAPIHKGVDPQLQPLVNEYKALASEKNLQFKHEVTVGFTDIKESNGKYKAVGVCYYGNDFREIDIDRNEWETSSEWGRKALLFHELTHCYCTRPHDWAKDKKYPEVFMQNVFDYLKRFSLLKEDKKPKPGYREDGCPISIMHPIVIDDDCMVIYYDQYMKEMFERCQTW